MLTRPTLPCVTLSSRWRLSSASFAFLARISSRRCCMAWSTQTHCRVYGRPGSLWSGHRRGQDTTGMRWAVGLGAEVDDGRVWVQASSREATTSWQTATDTMCPCATTCRGDGLRWMIVTGAFRHGRVSEIEIAL